MIHSGREYRKSIRVGREVQINREKINDVTEHPVNARRIYGLSNRMIAEGLLSASGDPLVRGCLVRNNPGHGSP